MDSNSIERVKSLIPSLPKKDVDLGYKFLEKRDFESLNDLVSSAVYKVKKNLRTSNPKEEYVNLDMDSLEKLQYEVQDYYSQFEPFTENELDDFTNMFLEDGECE
mgnify:CR=1 FL=1